MEQEINVYSMKLHETMTIKDLFGTQITKVPGGWIYRYYEEHITIDHGSRSTSITCDSVFVPYSKD